MMDTVRSFLRGVLDVGMAVIPVSVVLGVILAQQYLLLVQTRLIIFQL